MENQDVKTNDLLIVDGSSLLTTCYFATIPKALYSVKTEQEVEELYKQILHSPSGLYTNAILGFMRTVQGFLNEQKPKYIAFVFDVTRNTFRRQIYPLYKANREGSVPPLRQQLATIMSMLTESGFVVETSDIYEADDLAGSIAEKYYNTTSVKLFTKDRDYLQLIDDKKDIRVWLYLDYAKVKELQNIYNINPNTYTLPNNIFEFNKNTAKDFYGVLPKYVIDKKALEGDNSDNIPGVKGVGPKVAVPLINEYGTIEHIYEELEQIKTLQDEKQLKEYWQKSLGIARSPLKQLREGKDMAFLSKNLATIKKDCPIVHSLNDMDVLNIKYNVLRDWYDELDIRSL